MSVGVQKAWSLTAASNGSADTNINYAEGASFKMPDINDSARAAMAAIKGWANQIAGGASYGGAADAYTITSDAVAAIDTAYAAGMRFTLKANHTNTTTTPTLNVDGVGAVTITTPGGGAVAVGAIVSGGLYDLIYNATGPRFELASAVGQPLDATLTALAALSWSSGNALVQFTAADTVSLTLTPSVSSITASQGAAATTPSGTFVNTTDNANVRALRIEGDRATPATDDKVFASWYLSDVGGTQQEIIRVTGHGVDLTAGSADGRMVFSTAVNGVITDQILLQNAIFSPFTNDALSLGLATAGWSDLFLASGGVINWNNGAYTLTQNAGALEASGTFRARTALSSETSGTLTAASANKRVKATAGVTINDGVFTAEDAVEIYNDSDVSITITQDTGMTLRLAGTTSTGNRTLAARGIAYLYFDTNADAAVGGTGVT